MRWSYCAACCRARAWSMVWNECVFSFGMITSSCSIFLLGNHDQQNLPAHRAPRKAFSPHPPLSLFSASILLPASSFSNMFCKCFFTVSALIWRCTATALLVSPCFTSCITSNSRWVRMAFFFKGLFVLSSPNMKQVRYWCNTHFGVCSLYGQGEGQAVVDSWVFLGNIGYPGPLKGRKEYPMSNKECRMSNENDKSGKWKWLSYPWNYRDSRNLKLNSPTAKA